MSADIADTLETMQQRRPSVYGHLATYFSDLPEDPMERERNRHVRDALQTLPEGYWLYQDDQERDRRLLKRQVGDGDHVRRYVADQYTDPAVALPTANALGHTLGALNDLGVLPEGGRSRGSQDYRFAAFTPDDEIAVLEGLRTVDGTTERVEDAGERLRTYLQDRFEDRFTRDELLDAAADDDLRIPVLSTLGALVTHGDVEPASGGYRLA